MTTAEQPYALYQYLPQWHIVDDEYEVPHGINFKLDLAVRLHPKRKFVRGELAEVVYYASFDGQLYSDPVVRETFEYDRDAASQLAISRTQTIEWYLEDGSVGPHPKIRGPKFYSTIAEKRDELQRKRHNQTSAASEIAMGWLIGQGRSPLEGQAYWSTLVNEINAYESGSLPPLRTRIGTDTSPEWLDGDVGGVSLRSVMLDELS